MTEHTKISRMVQKDLKDVSYLVADLRTDMNGRVVCSSKEMYTVLKTSLNDPHYTGYTAKTKTDEIIGYLGINQRFAIYTGGKFFQITELYVLPSTRRRGIARALISAAELHTLTAGATTIELGAPRQEKHPGTLAFYEKQGYTIVGPRLSKDLTFTN
jgi:ribosomal protein S18 acetylase RimI-like enzyme